MSARGERRDFLLSVGLGFNRCRLMVVEQDGIVGEPEGFHAPAVVFEDSGGIVDGGDVGQGDGGE